MPIPPIIPIRVYSRPYQKKKILLPEHPDADAVSFRILWDAPARFKLSPGSYQDSDDFDPGLIYANCLLSSPPRIL